MTSLLAAALLLGAAARADDGRLSELQATLAHGLWNERMHAVQELAALPADSLPLLVFAADDADWQVRLSAVHQLGRLGEPAIPALAEVLRKEPCRHVRISAIHWLGSMGEPAAPVLEQALDDESRMLRLEDRYWLDKMGRAPAQSRDDAGNELSIASYEDLRLCAGSPLGGRLARLKGAAAAAADAAAPSPAQAEPKPAPAASAAPEAADYRQTLANARDLALKPAPPEPDSPAPPPMPPRPSPEVDSLRAGGARESLPPGDAAPERREPTSEEKLLALAARAKPDPALAPPQPEKETLPDSGAVPSRDEDRPVAELLAAPDRGVPDARLEAPRAQRPKESLPPGQAGPAPRERERPDARLESAAGTPKPETDPVPALVAQLSSRNPRTRARAADELGKRGAAAASAVAPVRRALRDSAPRVRAAAALALGNLGAAEAVRDLARAARDKDEDVRWSATVALGRIKTPSARAAFAKLVGAPPSN